MKDFGLNYVVQNGRCLLFLFSVIFCDSVVIVSSGSSIMAIHCSVR